LQSDGQDAAGHSSPITYRRRGCAALITIDRQHRRNAIDGPTAVALHAAFARFEADDQAAVMVLTGAGSEAFCSGADLKEIESFADRLNAPEGPLGVTRLTATKPTIAAISGYCVAGGLELALWCDLRIASDSALLGFTERRFGVPLIDGGTQRLPATVGLGRALELILTGRMVDAREALAMGLVSEVVPGGAHVARSLALAEELARFPQGAMRADRRAALGGLGSKLAEGLALEAQSGPETFAEAVRGAGWFAAGAGRGGGAVSAAGAAATGGAVTAAGNLEAGGAVTGAGIRGN
jgi:enoyl-CoA hydratase